MTGLSNCLGTKSGHNSEMIVITQWLHDGPTLYNHYGAHLNK